MTYKLDYPIVVNWLIQFFVLSQVKDNWELAQQQLLPLLPIKTELLLEKKIPKLNDVFVFVEDVLVAQILQ